MVNLDDLPDLCLIAILDRIPIRDLLHIGQVSRLFNVLQKTVISKKTTLRLFGDSEFYASTFYGDTGYRYYGIGDVNFDLVLKYAYHTELYPCEIRTIPDIPHPDIVRLKYDWLVTESSVWQFGRLFPNVKHLTVVTTNCWVNPYVGLLLRNWPELTTLVLLNHAHHGFHWGELRGALNQMKCLESLSTDMNLEQLTDLEPMARIRSLITQCYYAKDLPCFLPRINWQQFASFGLKIADIYRVNRIILSSLYRTPYSNITRASLTVQKITDLTYISAHWTSLRYLQLHLEPNPYKVYPKFDELLAPLAALSNLTELTITLSSQHDPNMKLSNRLRRRLPRLESIRRVNLDFVIDPHHLRGLESAFPNGQVWLRYEPRYLSGYKPFTNVYCLDCLAVIRQATVKYGNQIDSIYFRLHDGTVSEAKVRLRWIRTEEDKFVLNFDYHRIQMCE